MVKIEDATLTDIIMRYSKPFINMFGMSTE